MNYIKKTGNPNLDAKNVHFYSIILKITNNFKITKNPITNENLDRIINIANKNNLLLSSEILSVLFDNRQNVQYMMSYIEPRLITFFTNKNLLPPRGNKLFDIKLLTACIKIKTKILIYENNDVEMSNQFIDMDCLLIASKLYIWNAKLNKCTAFNLQDDRDILMKTNKELERYCDIAGVPIRTIKKENFEQLLPINNLTEKDYIFIINTALFIFVLFLLYVKYK
jgi:hypothetical protein